ncbi:MAG: hypothetical protein M3355_11870 [Actinomycetota bacterium]|nr:hypothetical protein [Actinomycetota bacterium]
MTLIQRQRYHKALDALLTVRSRELDPEARKRLDFAYDALRDARIRSEVAEIERRAKAAA